MELQEVLKNHKTWLKTKGKGGKRANLASTNLTSTDLRDANLRYADLRDTDLTNASLRDTNLRYASLRDTNLRYADLRDANLRYASLTNADLRGTNLRDTNLTNANLRYADLRDTNLRYASLRDTDLTNADLTNADLNSRTTGLTNLCPEGSFIGWKKASNHLIKLEITEDAKRSNATTLKCRCSKAKVLGIFTLDGVKCEDIEICSNYDSNFKYKTGNTVKVEDFDEDRWNECAPGIHFFIDKEVAKQY